MEFIKQYTFQILTLHTTLSFISQMVRRCQPCCFVIKPCSYESTQNSALFHLKLIKSTQHLYDTFFNWLNVSVSQSMVILLQTCTIFGVSCLHNYSRFAKIRFPSSNAMDYGIFVHALLKTPADFVLNCIGQRAERSKVAVLLQDDKSNWRSKSSDPGYLVARLRSTYLWKPCIIYFPDDGVGLPIGLGSNRATVMAAVFEALLINKCFSLSVNQVKLKETFVKTNCLKMHKQNETMTYVLMTYVFHIWWLSDYFSIFFSFRQKSSGYVGHLQTASNNLVSFPVENPHSF